MNETSRGDDSTDERSAFGEAWSDRWVANLETATPGIDGNRDEPAAEATSDADDASRRYWSYRK